MKFSKSTFNDLLDEWFSDKITKKSLHFDLIIMLLIFMSSLFFVFETSVKDEFLLSLLHGLDFGILIIFSLELILRVYHAKDKVSFFLSGYTWIDILVVVPFWLGTLSTSYLRLFRLFRVFRFFRFLNYSKRYATISDWNLEKLFVFRILFTVFMFMFVAAALIFQIEASINSNISTFWDAFYFVLISATTVGYGDIQPMTQMGRAIIMLTVVSAIIIVPVHITSMMKFLAEEKDQKHIICKVCDTSTHDRDAKYCKSCGGKL